MEHHRYESKITLYRFGGLMCSCPNPILQDGCLYFRYQTMLPAALKKRGANRATGPKESVATSQQI
jgi:hypothetical protein